MVESTLGGAVGFTVGARVSHPVHGNGIITRLIPPDNALVAIKDGFNRAWLDLPITELAIDGKPAKFLPEWTNPSVHLKDFKRIQIRFPSSNPELGCLPGADDAKVYYRRTKGGKRLKQKDYTRAVNRR